MLSVSLANSNNENDISQDNNTVDIPTTTMSSPTTKEPTEPWEKSYRLPTDTLPIHYEIYLHPDLSKGTFTGRVDVHMNITSERDFVLVHLKFLNITSSKMYEGHGTNGAAVKVSDSFEYVPLIPIQPYLQIH